MIKLFVLNGVSEGCLGTVYIISPACNKIYIHIYMCVFVCVCVRV